MAIMMGRFVYLLPLTLLLALALMVRQGKADTGTLTLPEGPPWHFWFSLDDPINAKTEVLKLKFNQSNIHFTVTKAGKYMWKYVVDVNGTQTPNNNIRVPDKPKSLGIILDESSIGIWIEQKNNDAGEVMALSPLNVGRIVQLESEHNVQYSGQATPIEKNIGEIIMKKCFSPPISTTSTNSPTTVTCPTQYISPKERIVPTTKLTENQNEVTTKITTESSLQTSENKSFQFTEGVSEIVKFQPTGRSEELINKVECSIPGYIWALIGLTSILAFLFIPLLVYAIRISRRYHRVCIKLESWKNQGDSKLPPYLDMSQNTLRRPQPLQLTDVNSICSANITPPHTPLSATESALSSHLFENNSSTLPRGGLIRTASISSYTNTGTKTIDSNSGYSSLKRQNSSNSYTNPTLANMSQFAPTPPPPLEEMEEEVDHTKHTVETAKENNIFVL